ncbi:AAA family ATPase [Staphylococcus chromogenes]|nr:AAA family ATPase [Staphylococcus chromogenes]
MSRISIVNYRNFARTNVLLNPGVNTIIGENGSGKSNLFRAIRLLLDNAFATRRHDLKDTDFHRGLRDWRGHWIVIMIEFADLSDDEAVQSLLLQHTADESTQDCGRATYALVFRPNEQKRNEFANLGKGDHTGLSALQETVTLDDYERVLLGKMSADLTDPNQYAAIVGDFDNAVFPSNSNGTTPDFATEIGIPIQRDMSLWREFSFTYVPALRNVVADFNDPWKNPLRTLLSAKSEHIPAGDLDDIIRKVEELNKSIEGRDDVQDITKGIQATFKEAVGETYSPTSMKIHSELPVKASDLFKSLKLYVSENGDASPRRLQEMSLGGANLVYLTLKLLEFEYQAKRQAIANFLIIEEPEAHIHTHVQKTLFDRVTFENTQIIYSTHSTHISEVSDIQSVNVLSLEDGSWVALQPSTNLKADEVKSAQRFLDAIRSNLLFSRSVLLVEGDAEEILIPNLLKKIYGIRLDEIGVSLINVRSTGFKNLGNLFHNDRLRKRCAIVTDLDATFFDTTPHEDDAERIANRKMKAARSAESGQNRKAMLEEFSSGNPYVQIMYARHTFEVDFADASEANRIILAATVPEIYRRTSSQQKIKEALTDSTMSQYGQAALSLANKVGKGWFALMVSNHLDVADESCGPVLPGYILNALAFTASELPSETWARVIAYRIESRKASSCMPNDQLSAWLELLEICTHEECTVDRLRERIEAFTDTDVQLLRLIQAFCR